MHPDGRVGLFHGAGGEHHVEVRVDGAGDVTFAGGEEVVGAGWDEGGKFFVVGYGRVGVGVVVFNELEAVGEVGGRGGVNILVVPLVYGRRTQHP